MSPRPDLGPKPQLGYTASLIERAAERRPDAAALAADHRAGAYVVGGELVIARKREGGGEPLFSLGDARALAPPVVRPISRVPPLPRHVDFRARGVGSAARCETCEPE